MKINMQGFSPGHAYLFTLVLCLFAGLINAGPLRSDHGHNHTSVAHASDASGRHHTAGSHKHTPVDHTASSHKDTDADHTSVTASYPTHHAPSHGVIFPGPPPVTGSVTGIKHLASGEHTSVTTSYATHHAPSHGVIFPGPPPVTGPVTGMNHLASGGQTSVVSMGPSAIGLTGPHPVPHHNHTGDHRPSFGHPTSGQHPSPDRPAGHPPTANDSLESRELVARHSYALVCADDPNSTRLCQEASLAYFCTSRGKLGRHGKKSHFCESQCKCVNLQPIPCIFVNVAKSCLLADNGTITDTDLQTIGDMESSTVASNGTLMVGTASIAVSKRDTDYSHTWAMVCGSDSNRYSTSYCYQAPHSYFCSSRGKLSTKGAGNKYCETICRCVNLITGTCVYGWAAAAVCRVGSDGTIFDSDLQIMGNTSIATQLSDGTWVLLSASKRGIDMMTISQDSVSDVETLPDTTLESSQALAARDDDVAHDYALVCYDREYTQWCQGKSYYCTSQGKVAYKANNVFCDDDCKCVKLNASNNPAGMGCVIVNEGGKSTIVCGKDVIDGGNATATPTILDSTSDLPSSTEGGTDMMTLSQDPASATAVSNTNAETLPDNILESSRSVAPRDDDVAHDWKMACLEPNFATECQKKGYYCTSKGAIAYKSVDAVCGQQCKCGRQNAAAPLQTKGCVKILDTYMCGRDVIDGDSATETLTISGGT